MAAGVPVICSRIPAHTDLLEALETGHLVGDAEDFRNVLRALDGPGDAIHRAERGRSRVMNAFGTWDDCARRYTDAYQTLLAPEAASCAS
jgi:glycosyltransferase involved in cell wall biosynthesis